MTLMETLMDEFQDEEEFKKLNEREVTAWLEVGLPKICSLIQFALYSNSLHTVHFTKSLG